MNRTRILRFALTGALLGIALGAAGLWRHPQDFPAAWLAALSALLNWPLGSMALLLVSVLTGGRWGVLLRPALQAGLATLPLIVLAALPYAFATQALYPWLHAPPGSLPNGWYLNAPFFTARGIGYLLLWLGLAVLIRRALRQPQPETALKRLAPAGLIVLALTGTFAAIDLTLSLDPHFASSIYGLIALVSMGLTALAAAVLFTAASGGLERAALPALGRVLQGLVLLWGYLDFMQLLILWQSNLLHDARWYVLRAHGTWGTFGAAVTACHLLLPVAILLWTPARRSPACIGAAAALLLFAEAGRAWWLVLPGFRAAPHLADAGAMLAVLAVATALVLNATMRERLLPAGRPLARV